MNSAYFRLTLSIALGLLFTSAHAETCVVNNQLWLQPRSGLVIAQDAGMAPCLHALANSPKATMAIVFPNHDESAINADELRQWFVALALPASRISMQKINDAPAGTPIKLTVQPITP